VELLSACLECCTSLKTLLLLLLFMSVRWGYVSELRPPTGLLFIPQMIRVWRASIEWYWNRRTLRKLYQWYLVHHKSHMGYRGANPGLRGESPGKSPAPLVPRISPAVMRVLWRMVQTSAVTGILFSFLALWEISAEAMMRLGRWQ
jgi:hypothetical protein